MLVIIKKIMQSPWLVGVQIGEWQAGHLDKGVYKRTLKNRWRLIEDGKTVEMELTQGKNTLFNVEHIDRVFEHVWYAAKKPQKGSSIIRWYAVSEISKRKQILLHTFLFPEYTQCNHINHNELDNRDSNVRDGSFGVSQRGRRKARHAEDQSLPVGVILNSNRPKSYLAFWHDADGRQRTKYFHINKYGGKYGAIKAAKRHRAQMSDEAVTGKRRRTEKQEEEEEN